jgi:hypothetical protein
MPQEAYSWSLSVQGVTWSFKLLFCERAASSGREVVLAGFDW